MHAAGMLHAAVFRSPVAHARITSLDVSAARALPGVRAIFTAPTGRGEPAVSAARSTSEAAREDADALASDTVRYVGEPIALIVADDRYIAEDAFDHIVIDFEELLQRPASRRARRR